MNNYFESLRIGAAVEDINPKDCYRLIVEAMSGDLDSVEERIKDFKNDKEGNNQLDIWIGIVERMLEFKDYTIRDQQSKITKIISKYCKERGCEDLSEEYMEWMGQDCTCDEYIAQAWTMKIRWFNLEGREYEVDIPDSVRTVLKGSYLECDHYNA